MNKEEFLKQIELVDRELADEKIPVHARAFRALLKLQPDYKGPLLGYGLRIEEEFLPHKGPHLFKMINGWYVDRYAERFKMPSDQGRIPVLIRREVYLIRIPLVHGHANVNIPNLIEGVTDSFVNSLDNQEIKDIKKVFSQGCSIIYNLNNMLTLLGHGTNVTLAPTVCNLLVSTREDRDTIARCLSKRLDTNNACFHAQQHAEKILKAYLILLNICTEAELSKRPYGHNLNKIYGRCKETNTEFFNVANDIVLLGNISMNIRYTTNTVSKEIGVETAWAALRVGGFCAQKLIEYLENPKQS